MICVRHPNGWIVILQPENLARMRQGDPVTIPDLNLILCYEDIPTATLAEKIKKGDPLDYLARGFTAHPDDFGEVTKL